MPDPSATCLLLLFPRPLRNSSLAEGKSHDEGAPSLPKGKKEAWGAPEPSIKRRPQTSMLLDLHILLDNFVRLIARGHKA
jgi:hypothetical protein